MNVEAMNCCDCEDGPDERGECVCETMAREEQAAREEHDYGEYLDRIQRRKWGD